MTAIDPEIADEIDLVFGDPGGQDDSDDMFDDPAEYNPWAGPVQFRQGRYYLPHPDTGKPTRFTRVSKVKEVIPDLYNLHQWKDRSLAKGLAMRPELVQLAAAHEVDDKDARGVWKDLVEKARDAAGGNRGSLHGTAFHAYTEYVDRGEALPAGVNEVLAEQLLRYRITLEIIGARTEKRWIERVLWHREHELVGRCDRAMSVDMDAIIALRPDVADWTDARGRAWVIGDVKSQKTMEYSNVGMAIQLAVYAASERLWDQDEGRWEDLGIELNRDIAIVMHTPSIDPRADLQVINLRAGKALLDLSMEVRKARNTKVNRPLVSVDETHWYKGIMNARSRRDLSTVFQNANARGEWTKAMRVLADRRLAELEGGQPASPAA